MRSNKSLVLLTVALATSFACKAGASPFGIASAYNLFAVGTVNAQGNTVIAGNINDTADINGRVAAANVILNLTTIGGSLNLDPFGALAPFDLVGENGINVGNSININSPGNAYGVPSPGTHINFNGGGHLVTTGGSGINFNVLRSTLDAQTVFLGALGTTGTIVGTNSGIPNVNPSFFVLLGTDPTLNVFNITAAELASTNNPIDIIAPVGSTIIVNVSGTTITVGGPLDYNNVQHSGDQLDDDRILFNFPDATAVHINAQFSASVLAPFAILDGSSQMDGNFIAAQIGATGQAHNVDFIGDLPQPPTGPPVVPEPGTLMLVGTGVASLAGALRRIKRS
jgi:choice-of-anchor A domain-containing protein